MKGNISWKRWHTNCLGHCTCHEENRRCPSCSFISTLMSRWCTTCVRTGFLPHHLALFICMTAPSLLCSQQQKSDQNSLLQKGEDFFLDRIKNELKFTKRHHRCHWPETLLFSVSLFLNLPRFLQQWVLLRSPHSCQDSCDRKMPCKGIHNQTKGLWKYFLDSLWKTLNIPTISPLLISCFSCIFLKKWAHILV